MAADPLIISFLLISIILTITPGADTILVLRNVLSGGRSSGIATTVGICSGLFVHATLSALGLSVILVRSAAAYDFVKTAGALYLIYLGLKSIAALLRKPKEAKTELPDQGVSPVHKPVERFFLEGFLNNVLNPKVAIFYLAFLPQFIRPSDPVLVKSIMLAGIHGLEGLVWLTALSFLIDKARALIQNGSLRLWLEGISGVVLVGLGIRLALEKR